MFFLLALIVLVACVLYFYFLGLWFLALVPLLFLVGWFAYVALKTPVSFAKLELSKYSLYIAWSTILLAVFGIFSFVWIKFPLSLLWMLAGNAMFLMLSYFFVYEDGKKIFIFWYYLSLLFLTIVSLFILPSDSWISLIVILLSFQFWFIWFLKFVIWNWIEIEKDYLYTLFVSWLLLISALIVSWVSSVSVALSIVSVLLMWLYLWLWWFVQKKPVNRGRVSVRRILAWERVTNKAFFSNDFLAQMYNFVVDMPKIFRYVLEALNVLVVLVLFGSFVASWSHMSGVNHFFYWIVISFFVWNVLLLKRIEYTSFLQNLFLFLVVHFAVYVSLFSYFESNIQSIVLWSVVWNIVTSLWLFVLPEKYKDFFDHKDYWYWIVASIMSFLVNVFLLLKSWLAGELIFFLLLLYLGIESMLVFYWIKHVSGKFQDNS